MHIDSPVAVFCYDVYVFVNKTAKIDWIVYSDRLFKPLDFLRSLIIDRNFFKRLKIGPRKAH